MVANMNQSETTAYNYLKSEKGYTDDQIHRESHKQTPDFIVKTAEDEFTGFEVKRPQGNKIVIHEKQISQIEDNSKIDGSADIIVADSNEVKDHFNWEFRDNSKWNIIVQERKGKAIWIEDDLEEELEKQKAPGQSWSGFLQQMLNEIKEENEA